MEWKGIKIEYTTWNDKKNSGMIWKAKYSIAERTKSETRTSDLYFILFYSII